MRFQNSLNSCQLVRRPAKTFVRFSRLFYSQAQRIELDRQGRLRIPPELVELATLEKDVVLVGVRDHLELWNKQSWQAYMEKQRADYDRLAEKAFTPPRIKE